MQLNGPNKVRTLFRLNMISTLFSSLNTKVKNVDDEAAVQNAEPKATSPQPVLLIIERMMPIFKDIVALWINEISVIEVCYFP